jgi:hypothetical protein
MLSCVRSRFESFFNRLRSPQNDRKIDLVSFF